MKTTIRSKIMDFVEQNGPKTRGEIVRFLREKIQGKDYDPVRDRGYYSDHFWKEGSFYWQWYYGGKYYKKFPASCRPGYLIRPSKNDPRYLKQDENTRKYSVVI